MFKHYLSWQTIAFQSSLEREGQLLTDLLFDMTSGYGDGILSKGIILAALRDSSTILVESEAFTIFLMIGTISLVALFFIHVGTGSRLQPFVGDLVITL